MGKKRIIKKSGATQDLGLRNRALAKLTKKKIVSAKLYVEATYNNTKISLTDKTGNVIIWSSCGALGFKGAKKSTPFAAAKVGELVGEKAKMAGVKDVDVVITGVGSGRESAVRAFISHGIDVNSIEDRTPVPHNGPKAKNPRRI
jgi:small subunit ribosomal protein S11